MVGRRALVIGVLGFAIAAGPSPSLAAEVGATVQSRVYLSEGRALLVLNRSDGPAVFSFEPSGGWTISPEQLVLEPEQQAAVEVGGAGEDGAAIAVRVTSVAEPEAGMLRGEALLVARVFYQRPPDYLLPAALGAVAILLLVALYLVRRRLRRAVAR